MGNKKAATPEEMSRGISNAFGDTEADGRKRLKKEDEEAAGPSAWETMKSLGGAAMDGAQDMAKNPKDVWDVIRGKRK